MKSRADYTSSIRNIDGQPCLLIEDVDKGNISVTNDIENIIEEIEQRRGIDSSNYIVIYRDSERIWDGWDGKWFVSLGASTAEEAVHKYMRLQLN